jgi:hypothetical protein
MSSPGWGASRGLSRGGENIDSGRGRHPLHLGADPDREHQRTPCCSKLNVELGSPTAEPPDEAHFQNWRPIETLHNAAEIDQ